MVIFDRFYFYLYFNENDLIFENDELVIVKYVWYLDWLFCDFWIFKNLMEFGYVVVWDNVILVLIISCVMVVVNLFFLWKILL